MNQRGKAKCGLQCIFITDIGGGSQFQSQELYSAVYLLRNFIFNEKKNNNEGKTVQNYLLSELICFSFRKGIVWSFISVITEVTIIYYPVHKFEQESQ